MVQCPHNLKIASTSTSKRATTYARSCLCVPTTCDYVMQNKIILFTVHTTSSASARARARASTAAKVSASAMDSVNTRERASSSTHASSQELGKITKFLHPLGLS